MKISVTFAILLFASSLFAQPDVMVRDSTGNILPQAAPGTTINLNVKLYVDIFWSARDGFMKNDLRQFTPYKPKDLFGFSNQYQSKWWPMQSDYQVSSIPNDFICWVYVEMRTADYNISYSLPGYLNKDGFVKDVDGNMFSITVAPNRNYFMIVHAYNGNSIVAADNGTALKHFTVTTANTLTWDFTDNWQKAHIHPTLTSYPMIELPSINGATVWAIPSGDVPESDVSSGDRVSTWDNFIDLSDLREITFSFGKKTGFSPYDLNLDKFVDVTDYLYVMDNTLFFMSGNPFIYKLRRN